MFEECKCLFPAQFSILFFPLSFLSHFQLWKTFLVVSDYTVELKYCLKLENTIQVAFVFTYLHLIILSSCWICRNQVCCNSVGFSMKSQFLIPPWLGQNSFIAVLIVTCLFWQTGESLETQSGPFRFLTVWDWSVQFDPKAQAFLNNPLYAEKPKPDKSQRKTARCKVRYLLLNLLLLSFQNKGITQSYFQCT